MVLQGRQEDLRLDLPMRGFLLGIVAGFTCSILFDNFFVGFAVSMVLVFIGSIIMAIQDYYNDR